MSAVRTLIALAGVLTALALPAPSAAITNGQPDDGRHPYVGALVSHDGRDRKHHLICSGSLLSPTVFVTASHCLKDEPANLYVSFDAFVGAPDVGPAVVLHPGTAVAHPRFSDETAPGDTHDVAVVRLDPPVTDVPTAELPFEGATAAATGHELVGYGREGHTQTGFFGGGGRRFAFGAFSALEDFKLLLDQSGTTGGTCNGDSGGPVLAAGTRTVLGVTSDGDAECAVSGIYYRLDTPSARAFLDDFVAVPQPPPGSPAPPPAPPAGAPPAGAPPVAPVPRPMVAARVASRFAVSARGALVRRLGVRGVPAGGVVEIRCRARSRCPFKIRSARGRTSFDLRRWFGKRRLRRGTVLQLRVFAPGAQTQTISFTVGRRAVRRR